MKTQKTPDGKSKAERREAFERAAKANPPPCDKDICGIMGIPCPRCQNKYLQAWMNLEGKK